MNTKKCLGIAMLAALSSLGFSQTGNPLSDGWSYGGHSFENGKYVRGGGRFSFDMYTRSFTVQSGSAFTSDIGGSSWQVGDEILGLGAVFVASPSAAVNGWANYSTNTHNDAIDSTMRMVTKFGASPTDFGASTLSPHSGNGAGSFSGGAASIGSVLIGNTSGDISATASGALRQGSVTQIYNGAGTDTVSNSVGRMMYVHNAGVVTSWEVFLNVTLLNTLYGGSYSDLANFGDRGVLTAQRGTSSSTFTDSMIDTEAVPEPVTLLALSLGAAAVAKRRKRK